MKTALLTITAIATLALTLTAVPASSQTSTRMSEASIRQYYATLPSLFKKPYEEFLTAYSARASDDLQVTNTTTVTMPGQPPVQSTETLTKAQMVEGAQQAYDAAKSAKLWNQVTTVDIAKDGMSAEVREVSRIEGMSAPSPDPERPFLADSTENCIDQLVFTPGVGIQMSKSDCTVAVTVQQKL